MGRSLARLAAQRRGTPPTRASRALEALQPAPTWPIAFALAAAASGAARATPRSPSPAAGPRTWCRRRSRRCRSARWRRNASSPGSPSEIPAAVDAALRARQRRHAGLRADARHPLGAARGSSTRGCSGPERGPRRPSTLRLRHRHERPARHPAPHPHPAAASRRRRRAGRLGQDDARRDALQGDARPLRPGRRHQRHLHQGRPAPAHRRRRARRRPHRRRRDRRLPAHRDPRGRVDQPRGDRPHAGEVPRRRHRLRRERRRQPRRDLQPRAERPDDLRDRRRRRREDPAQGRPRHHQERPVRHQQDRPRAARRRRAST